MAKTGRWATPRPAAFFREWMPPSEAPESVLVEAGIFVQSDEESVAGGAYPRFRDRLMFPIRNDTAT
jgi:DNA primase